jgi:hypothetical protein
MVVGLQQFCGLRILDDLGDLLADEIRRGVVGRLVEREDSYLARRSLSPSSSAPRSGNSCTMPFLVSSRATRRNSG